MTNSEYEEIERDSEIKDFEICLNCKFFKQDENTKSSGGNCFGLPVSTVDQDGVGLSKTKYIRRDNNDDACGLFTPRPKSRM